MLFSLFGLLVGFAWLIRLVVFVELPLVCLLLVVLVCTCLLFCLLVRYDCCFVACVGLLAV